MGFAYIVLLGVGSVFIISILNNWRNGVYLFFSSLLFEDLLGDVRFRSPLRDLDKSIAHVAAEVHAHLAGRGEPRAVERVEVIRAVFYQISRAYIVGRLVGPELLLPLEEREQARDGDERRDDPGEDRALDEELGNVHRWTSLSVEPEALRASSAASSPGRRSPMATRCG